MSAVTHLRGCAPATLVELLCEPGATVAPARLGEALEARLASLAASPAPRRLDAFCAERGPARFDRPFRWTARAARRTLGTAALRRMEATPAPDALRAARDAVDECCDRARRGLAWRGALAAWLRAQPSEVRAACAVEAATWATAAAQLVDLHASRDRLRAGVVDAWVEVPGARTTLHGRRDVAARAPGGGVLRLRDGAPGDRAVDGLCVDGLIAALADRASPARVLGAWPDAGVVVAVTLDDEALRRGARALLRAAAPVVEPVLVAA